MKKINFENGIMEIIGLDLLITVDSFSTIRVPMAREESSLLFLEAIPLLVAQGKVLGKRKIRKVIKEKLGL